MKNYHHSTLAKKLSKVIAVSAISALSLQATFATAAVSEELKTLNDRWQQVFSAKDLAASQSYYDASSLVASFPYDATKDLKGDAAIGKMFQNGPFNLAEFNVKVAPIGFDESGNSALLLKNWNVSHSGGAFSGLAVEVLEKKDAGWKRIIDMAAGGFSNPSDFAKAPVMAQKTFKAIDTSGSQVTQLTVSEQDKSLNKAIQAAIQAGNYEDLSSVSNADNGLLIARVSIENTSYITFNALKKSASSWQSTIQFFNAN